MFKKVLILIFCFSFLSSPLFAEEGAEANDYQYYSIEPDIITNYIKSGKRIGFIRMTVELMVRSKDDYALLEKHDPLIRDRIITILGEQDEKAVKSVDQRDAIRQRCVEELNELLFTETKAKPIIDVLFTKFLFQ
ncbi:flagellar basal body-associated FliL family protein [Psychromonas sp. PT13]|uniref:flagellar basal body-associated FliL family protein n=1 Tax=Psychromonas sp. PT13 TaxID=3439547 RepID=UPI003EBC6968